MAGSKKVLTPLHNPNIPDSAETDDYSSQTLQKETSAITCRAGTESLNNEMFLIVQISGKVIARKEQSHITAKILLEDITSGFNDPQPILCGKSSSNDSGAFIHKADIGKLPRAEMKIEDWMTIDRIPIKSFKLARHGLRKLQMIVSLHLHDTNETLAKAENTFEYHNTDIGYIDFEENKEVIKTLTVSLAFSVSAIGKKPQDQEVDIIRDWAVENLGIEGKRELKQFKKSLKKTVKFFRSGKKLDTDRMSSQLAQVAPIAYRYDMLELCMKVAQAKGTVTDEEMNFLKKEAELLRIGPDKFHSMMETYLPAEMHQTKDAMTILGITGDMTDEQVLAHLNSEYRKWNARVTHADEQIRKQAEQALELIAQTRSQYT